MRNTSPVGWRVTRYDYINRQEFVSTVLTKRKSIVVNNAGAATLSDYQVKITVSYDSGMSSDFSDLRFANITGSVRYPHWIESKTDGVSAVIWVKINSLPNGNTTIYLYYGGVNVPDISNGSSVFPFFENDFGNVPRVNNIGRATKLNLHTPDGSGETLHPKVVFIPEGFGGKKYWMVHTPYKDGNDDLENPCIECSDDGITWSVPTGLTNPISPMPPTGWQHDPDLEYDPSTNRLYVYWCRNTNTEQNLLCAYSTDGIIWRRISDGVDISTISNADHTTTLRILGPWASAAGFGDSEYSPCVVRMSDGTWHLWMQTRPIATYITTHRTSLDGYTWGASELCTHDVTLCATNQATYKTIWHMGVIFSETLNEFLMVIMTNGSDMRLAHSVDGKAWVWYAWPICGLNVINTEFDAIVYRPCLIEYDGIITCFSSFIVNPDGGSVNDCWIGRFNPINANDFINAASGLTLTNDANIVSIGYHEHWSSTNLLTNVSAKVITLSPTIATDGSGVAFIRAGSYKFTSNKMFRVKMKPNTNINCGIGFGELNIRPGTGNTLVYSAFNRGYHLLGLLATPRWYTRKIDDATESILQNEVMGLSDMTSGFHTWELGLSSTGILKPKIDDVDHPATSTNLTDYLTNLKFPYVFRGISSTTIATAEIDWMLIRNWVPTEPTVGAASTQITGTFNIIS